MSDVLTILTDEFATVVEAVKTALNLSVLEYQYGYIEELNVTLKEFENNPTKFDKKFPMIWLAEPFDTVKGEPELHGICDPDIFIFAKTKKEWKASKRMTEVFIPVIYPIYNELLKQIVLSTMFDHIDASMIKHTLRKGYYWDEQSKVFNSDVDCLRIRGMGLRLFNKQNCTPIKSF